MRKYFPWRWLMVGILGALLLWGWGCENKRLQVVARVGNDAITLQQFEEEIRKGKTPQVVKTLTLQQHKEFLEKMIDRRLKLLAAGQQRLEQQPEIAAQLQDLRKQMAYYAAIDNDVVLKVINEAEIRDFYDHSQVRIRARHILWKLPPKPTDEEVQQAMDKAEEVIKQLRTGADFSEMAKRYSEDQETAKRGGDLGYIRWESKSPEFQQVAFALAKFQISQPVRTTAGIHIIQVTDRQNLPQRPYEVAREDIIRTLSQKRRSQLMKTYRDYVTKLKESQNVTLVQANIDTLWTRLSNARNDSSRKAGLAKRGKQFDTLSAKDRQMVVVQYKNDRMTVDDFIGVVRKMSPRGREMPIRRRGEIERILNRGLEFELLAGVGMRRGWDKQKKYQARYKQVRDRILLDEVRKQEVDQKVSITDEQLTNYYQANQERYKIQPQVEVQEIYVTGENVANRVYTLAKRGRDFDKLAERYNERATTKNKQGRLGFITSSSYGKIGQEAFQMKVGEIQGPIKTGNNFSIIKVLSRKEVSYRPFEEVKRTVKRDARRELVQKREQEWLAGLRSCVPVRIFEDVLRHAFADLKTN